MTDAVLTLEDGTIFNGKSIGAEGSSIGEVVFNTAMTGYQEILTDPSYFKQIVTLTYPHIGNTGTNREDFESAKTFASGLIIKETSPVSSNWRNEIDLEEFLTQQNIVAISDIDTRKLTNHLRSNGSMSGCISSEDKDIDECIRLAQSFPGLAGMDLAKEVTTEKIYDFQSNKNHNATDTYKVVALDFGIKTNILNLLHQSGCDVRVVPGDTSFSKISEMQPDGIFLSNGPGDPEPCDYAIKTIKSFLEIKIPMFGICLGHQLLALASGGKTEKMKFGHHGANHPVQDLLTGEVFITSQNHGFTVNEDSLPENVSVSHRSLFDQTIQGIEIIKDNAFSFQGHPEASPGPHDINSLFNKFTDLMSHAKKN